MNWSHALLAVSGACVVALIVTFYGFIVGMITAVPLTWPLFLFVLATISGALAAGLWR